MIPDDEKNNEISSSLDLRNSHLDFFCKLAVIYLLGLEAHTMGIV